MRSFELYDHFVANRFRLLDVKWLEAFLRPHCRSRILGLNGSRLRILQHPVEFANFLIFMAKEQVSSYLEVGTSTGGSWMVVDAFLRASVPAYKGSVGYDIKPISKVRDWDIYRKRFATIRYHQGNSTDIKLGNLRFDMAFIDARHEESWVLHDYQKVRQNSRFVAFHDIVAPGATVGPAWNKIKRLHDVSIEFVASQRETVGIGVVRIEN